MKEIFNPSRFILNVTGVDFNSKVDIRLIPTFYNFKNDSVSLLFSRAILKSEGSIFTLLEVRKFNNSSKFNLTLSVKNLKGPDHLPPSAFVRVINAVASIYGKDESGMEKVENEELEDLEKNIWLGRSWLNTDIFKVPVLIGQDEGYYFYITFFLDSLDFE